MSRRIVAATLLGPEPQYGWPRVKAAAAKWSDQHIIVDDYHGNAWGNETPFRQQLWHEALDACDRDDWIFILDSDFVLTFDPHDLSESDATSWAFSLYDMWDETHYRADGMWRAHNFPRAWMFSARHSPQVEDWLGRGIHSGHVPANFPKDNGSVAPSSHAIIHIGWSTSELRTEKYHRYMQVEEQLGRFELNHVKSIMDVDPRLLKLPSDMLVWLQK